MSMTEPTITCPKCKEEIKLTESLAAPLIAATRHEMKALLVNRGLLNVAVEGVRFYVITD